MEWKDREPEIFTDEEPETFSYCQECDKIIEGDYTFCPECGELLIDYTQAELDKYGIDNDLSQLVEL